MPSPQRFLRRRLPPVYRMARRGFEALANRLPPWHLPPVVGPVSRADLMMRPSLRTRPPMEAVRHYDTTGRQAAALLVAAVEAAGRSAADVESVLDLGCGHGRVARHLGTTFPSGRIVCCDIDPYAAAFCDRHFATEGHAVQPDPRTLPPGPFDLVWMGSVLTHVDAASFDAIIAEVAGRLGDGGVTVFSTHSAEAAAAALATDVDVPAELASHGIAYTPYEHSADGSYGLTFHTAEYVLDRVPAATTVPLSNVMHRPRGWSDHHDVWAFART